MSLLLTGLALYVFVVVIGFGGVELMHYWWALVLLGVGWNLLFLTSTALLPRTYTDEERSKAQALNDFLIFTVQACAAFGAGWLLFNLGWNSLLWIALIISGTWFLLLIILHRFDARSQTITRA